MTAALQALAERLEKADGPDREIDALLCVAFADVPEPPDAFKLGACPPRVRLHDDWRVDCVGVNGVVRSHTPKPYSASLDAAIALCERVSAWGWSVDHYGHSTDYVLPGAFIHHGERVTHANAPTPALALVLAVVRARIVEETP